MGSLSPNLRLTAWATAPSKGSCVIDQCLFRITYLQLDGYRWPNEFKDSTLQRNWHRKLFYLDPLRKCNLVSAEASNLSEQGSKAVNRLSV